MDVSLHVINVDLLGLSKIKLKRLDRNFTCNQRSIHRKAYFHFYSEIDRLYKIVAVTSFDIL